MARGDFRKNLRLNGCRSWTGVGWKSKLRAGSARESLQGRWRRPKSPSASRLYSAARAATCLLD
jgi:hypothetical protein